jgi:tRNA 5-methylaminomethyl-2-thiouridine biosynthesis bifunctional protein
MSVSDTAISAARLQWLENGALYSLDYEDIYYSDNQALAESTHVFLQGNHLQERWQQLQKQNFIIGELGFGGGLNFLNTCRLWTQHAPGDACLHYVACELHPLHKDDLERLYRLFPHLENFSAELLDNFPPICPGVHQRILKFGEHRIRLNLLFGDAGHMLEAMFQKYGFRVDAWYLDGFSPKKNPALWQQRLCASLANLSHEGTTLSTYSAAALIKRSLQQTGFSIQRVKGFDRKRHMLEATYQTESSGARIRSDAYTMAPALAGVRKKALVIGAGLAGCSTAHALAENGWQVTVLERDEQAASQASGNKRGILSCRLSLNSDSSSDFYLHAYLHALAHYSRLARQHHFNWQQKGHLHQASTENELARQTKILNASCLSDFSQILSAESATEQTGIRLQHGGLYFPEGATLNPGMLCQAYLTHKAIQLQTHQQAISLQYQQGQWQVNGNNGQLASADLLVIANSHDANAFLQTQHYPLQSNYGQIDEYQIPDNSKLNCSIGGKSYLVPVDERHLLVGGLTVPGELEKPDEQTGKDLNLKLLAAVNRELAGTLAKQESLQSRMGVRCSSPDFMPLAGPVEDRQACEKVFQPLRLNARKPVNQEAVLLPGLFINVAHGAHGLSSTPLCAATIAAMADGLPLPITDRIIEKLHPIRFLIRELKRQKN